MLWSALDLYGQTVQWMEWIVNLDFGPFRTQGILGVGATTRTFIASSPAAESPMTAATGIRHAKLFSSRTWPWPSCCAANSKPCSPTNAQTWLSPLPPGPSPGSCRMPGHEFMRRFLQHVLPKGLHKVRYFGLWHPSQRQRAAQARLLLELERTTQPATEPAASSPGKGAESWQKGASDPIYC